MLDPTRFGTSIGSRLVPSLRLPAGVGDAPDGVDRPSPGPGHRGTNRPSRGRGQRPGRQCCPGEGAGPDDRVAGGPHSTSGTLGRPRQRQEAVRGRSGRSTAGVRSQSGWDRQPLWIPAARRGIPGCRPTDQQACSPVESIRRPSDPRPDPGRPPARSPQRDLGADFEPGPGNRRHSGRIDHPPRTGRKTRRTARMGTGHLRHRPPGHRGTDRIRVALHGHRRARDSDLGWDHATSTHRQPEATGPDPQPDLCFSRLPDAVHRLRPRPQTSPGARTGRHEKTTSAHFADTITSSATTAGPSSKPGPAAISSPAPSATATPANPEPPDPTRPGHTIDRTNTVQEEKKCLSS